MLALKVKLSAMLLFLTTLGFGQAKGNYDYRAANSVQYNSAITLPSPSSLLNFSPVGQQTFSIKGLYNCSADSYLAIFSITQVGLTQKETDDLIQAKIETIKMHMKDLGSDIELYVDMISFVPIYEYEVEKKLFSKKTYNEIPKGFELKKNLHFKYTNSADLEHLVTICADQEIYDLVRVDYFVDDMESKKNEMIARAEAILIKKMSRFQRLSKANFDEKLRLFTDGFAIHYPVEQYQSYQAYCSNAMNFKVGSTVNTQTKVTSQYYMPKQNKGYDFVVNPAILEPVVQIEYEVKLHLYPKPEEPKKEPEIKEIIKTEIKKEIYLVTPTAEVKKITL